MHKMYIKCLIISKLCTKNVYHFIPTFVFLFPTFYVPVLAFSYSLSTFSCSLPTFVLFFPFSYSLSPILLSLLSSILKKETVTLSFKVRQFSFLILGYTKFVLIISKHMYNLLSKQFCFSVGEKIRCFNISSCKYLYLIYLMHHKINCKYLMIVK